MAGSTKLFQQAGSPLIQGRSRYERSFWRDWALAAVVALVVVVGFQVAVSLLYGPGDEFASASAIGEWLVGPAIGVAVMLPASAFAVWLGRWLGWRAAWLGGALLGAAAGILALG